MMSEWGFCNQCDRQIEPYARNQETCGSCLDGNTIADQRDRIAELEKALRSIAVQHTSDELRPLLDGHQDGDYEESHNTMIGIARAALGIEVEAQDE